MKLQYRYIFFLSIICFCGYHAESQVNEWKDSSAVMQKVADGVYVILHDNATDQWPHGNTGVIVGDDGVLVVDACYLPSRAEKDILLIKKITAKPVKYLVFTHWHFDHNNGTIAYKQAFPSIHVISERESAKYIELNGKWWAAMSTAPQSARIKEVVAMEKELAQGKDTSGKAFTKGYADTLATTIRQRRNELRELSALQVVMPDSVFDNELVIRLGKRNVILHDWGKGNSPHDVTIYLPEEKILFSGDLLVQSPRPYTGASWPVQWVKVLKQIENIPVKTLVLGHGPVQHDHSYTRKVRQLMEEVLRQTEIQIRKGSTLQEAQAAVTLTELYTGVWNTGEEDKKTDWKIIIQVLVERAWRSVRGQG